LKTKVHTAVSWEESLACSYRSELGGIFSLVLMIQHICQYYMIMTGQVSIACDGLGPLVQCFAKFKEPDPQGPHFDMISSIRKLISSIPVSWHWHHVAGHQEASSGNLDKWAIMNIQMDKDAKQFWEQLSKQGYMPTSQSLPGEGWTIWQGKKKFSSLQTEKLRQQMQSRYSSSYWRQPLKLATCLIPLTGM